MKKKYIIPTLDVIKVQMIGVVCSISGGNTPKENPNPGPEFPPAAPKVA